MSRDQNANVFQAATRMLGWFLVLIKAVLGIENTAQPEFHGRGRGATHDGDIPQGETQVRQLRPGDHLPKATGSLL